MRRMSGNKNGITLVSLVITIVVLMIILGITLNYGLSEIHDVANKKTESELTIVQEAVMQRYALVKSKDQLGITADDSDTDKPEGFIGTRVLPSTIVSKMGTGVSPMKSYTTLAGLYYEEYYYQLSEADLADLGIEKGDDSKISDDVSAKDREYIVNYLTGEVFDVANKKYYKTDVTNDDPIYTQPTQIDMDSQIYDFNDD
ncbi:MAG: hypothetical protein IJ867_00575 [Clostridia bacterium]|nr:hypothetical protein [Clostridia bacterium]